MTVKNTRVRISHDASIVNHRIDYFADAAWRCRYSTPTRQDAMAMASVYEDYDCLFSMTNKQRNHAINAAKRAMAKTVKEKL